MPAWNQQTYTTADGYQSHYRHYPAEGSVHGEIVCLHGIQSHAGWYEGSCQHLARAGYNVSFLERRGSGQNQVDRGDAPGFRRLVEDVADYVRPLREQSRGRPLILLAISWGGKLALALQSRHPDLLDGLALLCPGFCSIVRPPLRERLGILWARLRQPKRLFDVPLNQPELFTSNPTWLAFLREDSFALRQATARLLLESVRLDLYLRVVARAVRVPALILLAGQDRIIDNRRTRRFVRRFRGPYSIIEYANAHHTLEFEPNPEVYLGDLTYWLGSIHSTLR